ncbi:MAG: hypothetical protein NDJ89_18850 [Oligoflexia bacterium]|nr:hypothetical protein [Oligoflexia bacterium]
MGIEKLISAATALAMMAAASGQLPRMTRAVQLAQLQLLKESQASRWGRLPIVGISGQYHSGSRSKGRAAHE